MRPTTGFAIGAALVLLAFASPVRAREVTIDIRACRDMDQLMRAMQASAPRDSASAMLERILDTSAYRIMFRHYNRSWRPNHLPPAVFERMILSLQYPGEYTAGENQRADAMLVRWRAAYADLPRYEQRLHRLEEAGLPALIDRGVAYAQGWLPHGWTIPDFPLVVLPQGGSPAFSIDGAQGYDFLQLPDAPDGGLDVDWLVGTIAHESNHLGMRGQELPLANAADSVALKLVSLCVAEGVATEFISGPPAGLAPAVPGPYHVFTPDLVAAWNARVLEEPAMVGHMAELLDRASHGQLTQDSLDVEMRSYWFEGTIGRAYVLGSDMFGAIHLGLGKSAVLTAIEDPRRLFQLYDQAIEHEPSKLGRCVPMPDRAVQQALAIGRTSPSKPLTPGQRAQIFASPASVTTKDPVTRIPMEGTDQRGFYKCPYFQVRINGKGPFTFLFDTGASYTAVTSKVIAAAHIPVEVDRGGYHDLVRIQEMKIGGVEIRNYVAVRDDDFGVDGVLGFRSFGDMNLGFELERRQLLVSREPVPLPGGFELPYELPHNVPTVPVTVGDSVVTTLLDTGDDAYAWEARTEDLKGATLAHSPAPADELLNGAKTQQSSVSTLESAVRLGPIAIEHAVVGINDDLPVPDFGVDYLKEFNFEIEPKRMRITFQPLTPTSGTRIRGSMSAGFTLHFDDKGTVHTVVSGSAAEQRGMHSGDRVLSLDGRPIAEVDPRTWDRLLATGKPLSVRWLKDTTERTDEFEVTEFH